MPTIEGRFLIDTNVLIYSTLEGDPRTERAIEILERGADCEAFVSAQNLGEMYPNLTGPKTQPPDTPAQAREKIRRLASLPHVEVLPVTAAVIETALELAEKYHIRRQKYFDMQLVAAMLVHDVQTLVTENESDFNRVSEINVVNPFA